MSGGGRPPKAAVNVRVGVVASISRSAKLFVPTGKSAARTDPSHPTKGAIPS